MTAPAYLRLRVLPTHDPAIPPMLIVEEQAYCRNVGLDWYPRSLPEVPRTGHHPRSACKHLPSIARGHRLSPGQINALTGRTDA